MTIFYAINVEL